MTNDLGVVVRVNGNSRLATQTGSFDGHAFFRWMLATMLSKDWGFSRGEVFLVQSQAYLYPSHLSIGYTDTSNTPAYIFLREYLTLELEQAGAYTPIRTHYY